MNIKGIIRSVLFLGLAGALLLASGQAQAAVISLSPSTPTPTVGNNFSVDVLVTGVFDAPHVGDELFAFGFDLSGLGGIISYLNFTPGPLFGPLVIPGIDAGGLSLDPSIVAPITEPLLLGTLNFQAIAPGVLVLSISADPIGDLNEGLQYLSGSDDIEASTTLNVGAAGVPEPGSILLTAAGLALVAFRFAKR